MTRLRWYDWAYLVPITLTGLWCLAYGLRSLWLQTQDSWKEWRS